MKIKSTVKKSDPVILCSGLKNLTWKALQLFMQIKKKSWPSPHSKNARKGPEIEVGKIQSTNITLP
jgi:hypothetical protein